MRKESKKFFQSANKAISYLFKEQNEILLHEFIIHVQLEPQISGNISRCLFFLFRIFATKEQKLGRQKRKAKKIGRRKRKKTVFKIF